MSSTDREAIVFALVHLLTIRGPDKSICPSEVARHLWPDDWRSRMHIVCDVAASLAAAGRLESTQQSCPVDPRTARGPVRFRLSRS